MARISSFFMGGDATRSVHALSTGGRIADGSGSPSAQTVSRSRAPVSEEGWRSLDMARASI